MNFKFLGNNAASMIWVKKIRGDEERKSKILSQS